MSLKFNKSNNLYFIFFYNKNSFKNKNFLKKNFFFFFFFLLLKMFNKKKKFFLIFYFKFLFYFNLIYSKKYFNMSYINTFKNIKLLNCYAYVYNSKEVLTSLMSLIMDKKGYNICSKEDDLTLWYKGKKELIFFNFFFFFKNMFFFFPKWEFLNYNLKFIEKLFFFSFKNKNWLKYIYDFKLFKKFTFILKNKFFSEYSVFFWKIKLKYWFEYYKLVKNSLDFFSLFFYIFKMDCLTFFYFFKSMIYSKIYLLMDYYSMKLKYFGYFYNVFLSYIFDRFFFDYYYWDIYWLLMKLSIVFYSLFSYMAAIKAVDSMYGFFQHVHKLYIYFDNLMMDTTYIDMWLENNNLSGKKISLLFLKGLFLLDGNFNMKSSPWHCFFKSFYDILFYMSIYKKKNKVFNQLYKILYKILYFMKNNSAYLSKKSFSSPPWSWGNQLYL